VAVLETNSEADLKIEFFIELYDKSKTSLSGSEVSS
jgi:hypothetical protein